MTPGLFWKLALTTALFFYPALRSLGATDAPPAFQQAYYLETHDHDLAGAARLYQQVASNKAIAADIRAEARHRLACCTEDLRAADLASLMPADALFYVELTNPGDHLEALARMLDVVGNPLGNIGKPALPVPGEDGLVIPKRILLSPALLAQADTFNGVAVAMTGLNVEQEMPEGVLILHPGDVTGLRGMIETGAQFVRSTEPIAGFPTVVIEEDGLRVVGAFTARLVIVGTSRDIVQDVVSRLQTDKEGAGSLATAPAFTHETARRDGAMLYAFVNMEETLKHLYRMMSHDPGMRDEMMQAQLLLDIAHLNSVSLALGTGSDALTAEFAMNMDPEQTSLIYNLLRTPPMQGRVLQLLPPEAAAFLAVAINPGDSPEAANEVATKTQTVQAVTGLDVGRELFGNIREAAVFLVPPKGAAHPDVPDVGMILAVGDPAKSEALWGYLLGLPVQAMGIAEGPRIEQHRGVEVQCFPVDKHVQIRLARTEQSIVVALTAEAMDAALAVRDGGRSVLEESEMRAPLSRITSDTSIALVAHLGRLAKIGAAHESGEDRAVLTAIANAACDLQATIVIDESQTHLRAAGRLTGLPRVADVLEALAQAGLFQPAPSHVEHASAIDARTAPSVAEPQYIEPAAQ